MVRIRYKRFLLYALQVCTIVYVLGVLVFFQQWPQRPSLMHLINTPLEKWSEADMCMFLEIEGVSSSIIAIAKQKHVKAATLVSSKWDEMGILSKRDEDQLSSAVKKLTTDGYRPSNVRHTELAASGPDNDTVLGHLYWVPPFTSSEALSAAKAFVDETITSLVDNLGQSLPPAAQPPSRCYVLRENEFFVYQPQIHSAELQLADRNCTIETLSVHPRVFRIHKLLTERECEFLIEHGAPLLKQMGEPWRTCTTAFVKDNRDHRVREITQLIDEISKVTPTLRETMHLLRFQRGQFHSRHHDYYDPASNPNYFPGANHANRLLTVYVDLSEDVHGGELCFPEANVPIGPDDVVDKNCGTYKSRCVKAAKGSATLIYSLYPGYHNQTQGVVDPSSIHNVCSVVQGEKWAAAFFIRNKHPQKSAYFAPQQQQ